MNISDLIEEHINSLLKEGEAMLSRAGLAGTFNCAPSQINYVLTTRFSPERGYMIETRRGGGGYIRVTRAAPEGLELMHAVNAVGRRLDPRTAEAILINFAQKGILHPAAAGAIAAAVSDAALASVPASYRPAVRADIFKTCLIQAANTRKENR